MMEPESLTGIIISIIIFIIILIWLFIQYKPKQNYSYPNIYVSRTEASERLPSTNSLWD